MKSQNPQNLRRLPAVERSPQSRSVIAALCTQYGRAVVAGWVREVLDEMRNGNSGDLAADPSQVLADVVERVGQSAPARDSAQRLRQVINGTGVVIHTNLGRAPLAPAAIAAIAATACGTNLEIDLLTGHRGQRGAAVESLCREITGAETALVVNNCAAATLLALQTLAAGRRVVISRGQLIEIGGSFRLPDVFRQAGVELQEVGTTNRTRLADYEMAIGPETAALLRVHPSNYRITGFCESVSIAELAELAKARQLPVIDDVGSGCLYDLSRYGLPDEPIVADSLKAGADLVLFSGDKLLGGPQCGIIVGRSELVEKLRTNPLARAVRVDKLTLAALQATLEIHRADGVLRRFPFCASLPSRPRKFRIEPSSSSSDCHQSPSPDRFSMKAVESAPGGGAGRANRSELGDCRLGSRSRAGRRTASHRDAGCRHPTAGGLQPDRPADRARRGRESLIERLLDCVASPASM